MARGQVAARTTQIWLNGQNVSGDLNSATFSYSAETPENTTFGMQNRSFLTGGLRVWDVSWDGYFNDVTTTGSPGIEHILTNIGPGGSAVLTMLWHGNSTSNTGYAGVGIVSSFEHTAPVDGAVSTTLTFASSATLARVFSLAGSVQSGSTAASTYTNSYDMGGSHPGAFHGFLHLPQSSVSAANAASGQFVVQHSGDDTTFADLLTFTTVDFQTTASTYELKSTTAASRYIRAGYAIGGVNASAVFLIVAGSS